MVKSLYLSTQPGQFEDFDISDLAMYANFLIQGPLNYYSIRYSSILTLKKVFCENYFSQKKSPNERKNGIWYLLKEHRMLVLISLISACFLQEDWSRRIIKFIDFHMKLYFLC